MSLKFEIVKHIGILSKDRNSWTKEINIVKWGENAPKYDIRSWSEDHSKMSKGITLTKEELDNLFGAFKDENLEKSL
ncbi:hypothetical protein LV469_03850 [Peptoniphilus sp. GNH]|nr:hypothetical protein LV469_03850 [Peptoniphilus sp. GNH]